MGHFEALKKNAFLQALKKKAAQDWLGRSPPTDLLATWQTAKLDAETQQQAYQLLGGGRSNGSVMHVAVTTHNVVLSWVACGMASSTELVAVNGVQHNHEKLIFMYLSIACQSKQQNMLTMPPGPQYKYVSTRLFAHHLVLNCMD